MKTIVSQLLGAAKASMFASLDSMKKTVLSTVKPATREVRIVQRGPLRIAVPVEDGPSLIETTVEHVRQEIRES